MTDVRKLGDVDLADLLKSGDHAAFTEVYDRYKGLLYIFAYKRIGDREEARDIIHELFTALWEKHSSLNITGNLLPYLYTAVRNRIMDRIARQKVAARYLDDFQEYIDSDYSPADHLTRMRNLENLIEREIAALPPKMRKVFLLSRDTELSRKEIAQELDISEETVKSHMHHALKILKGRLGPLVVLLFILH